jgi:hypothetical protein
MGATLGGKPPSGDTRRHWQLSFRDCHSKSADHFGPIGPIEAIGRRNDDTLLPSEGLYGLLQLRLPHGSRRRIESRRRQARRSAAPVALRPPHIFVRCSHGPSTSWLGFDQPAGMQAWRIARGGWLLGRTACAPFHWHALYNIRYCLSSSNIIALCHGPMANPDTASMRLVPTQPPVPFQVKANVAASKSTDSVEHDPDLTSTAPAPDPVFRCERPLQDADLTRYADRA